MTGPKRTLGKDRFGGNLSRSAVAKGTMGICQSGHQPKFFEASFIAWPIRKTAIGRPAEYVNNDSVMFPFASRAVEIPEGGKLSVIGSPGLTLPQE